MIGDVYGFVNGKAVYSRDEFVYECRGFGHIDNDDELLEFAKKVTYDWSSAGWHHSFTGFYLSDYALDEPNRSLTKDEFERLKEMQRKAIEEMKRADAAREWKFKERICWADNSVEEIWVDKDGIEKTVMTVQPHGDVC